MDAKSYSSNQLEQITGMKAKTLHYYIEAGAVTPGVQDGKGSGKVRLFGPSNLTQAKIIHSSIEIGLPKRTIILMMKSIADDTDKLDPYKIVEAGGKIFLHFLYSSKTGEIVGRFDAQTPKGKSYLGHIDLSDYDIIPLSIRFNLSVMAKQVVQEIKKLTT